MSCLLSNVLRSHLVFWLAIVQSSALPSSPRSQEARPADTPTTNPGQFEQQSTITIGDEATELDNAIYYVFQAKNGDYWFGSDDRGVYRYNGTSLVNYSTKDGLPSNRIRGIQGDTTGNIYFTTYEGISKFDGQSFTTLDVSPTCAAPEWRLQSGDLWFVAGQDSGAVYRYDGTVLHRLELPRTKAGDEHVAAHPREKFPNAKYSPYDVFSIFRDSKGNMWFGTAILGVCRYDGEKFGWIPEEDLRNGSFGTRSIIEDKEGKFWFCNSLHRYNVETNDTAGPTFEKGDGFGDPLDQSAIGGIMSAAIDSAGALWLATYGDGVWCYDGKKASHYPVSDSGQPVTLISIYKDNHGVMWLGTHRAGAYRFNGTTFERFIVSPQAPHQLK